MFKCQFISCLKSKKIIFKACIYYIVGVRDTNFGALTFELILIVSEFFNVFLDDLPSVPPKKKINFDIDLLLDTQHS